MPGIDATAIDLIVLATATPDQTFPSSATKVQAMLGINDCIAFDVHAVCTGFLYALTVADSMLRSGNRQDALVIGSETFSRILDWEDRATCVLFGDGAGALVLAAEEGERGILATKLHADGRHNDLLFVDGGPSTTGTVGKLRMKGREVFRHAVVNLADVLNEVLAEAGLSRATSTGSCRIRPMRGSSTRPRGNWAFRRKKSSSRSTACQYLRGLGSAGVRHRGARRPHQARRPCRARSDGWGLYMGRGSAQILINIMPRRIADTGIFPLRSVKMAGGSERGRGNMADLGIARCAWKRAFGDSDAGRPVGHRPSQARPVARRIGQPGRARSSPHVPRASEGQNVKISGFGSFILRDKGQRIGRNPKTGVEVPIAPRRVMTFRASQIMRDRIAK